MINCPHCDQPVDETVRSTCPLCFTPLQPEATAAQTQPGVAPNLGTVPQQPQMSAPPLYQPAPPPGAPGQPSAMPLNAPPGAPLRAPNTRMTLNGDIIETPPTPAASPMGGNYAGRPAAPRPSYGASSARVEPKSRSGGSTAIIVVVLLLLLGGGGFGGYYWWSHRTNPKDTTTKYLTAIKSQDWKTIYELTDSDQMKSKFTSAQDFADKTKAQLTQTPGAGQFLDSLFSSLKFEVQDTKDNDGSTATVPIKVTMNLLGRDISQNEDVKLKNVGGIWKVSGGSNGMGLGAGMGLGGGTSMGGGRMGGGMGGLGGR